MKVTCLLPCLFAVAVFGTPAKRSCPQERCVDVTNSCGEPIRECWDDCALGVNGRPTFVAPPCTVSTALREGPSTASKEPIIPPDMTSTPNLSASPTETCSSEFTICIDYLKACDNGTYNIPYGGCHDACSKDKKYPVPSCTKTRSSGLPTTTTTKSKKAAHTREACKNEKAWMCPPPNW